MGKLSSFSIEGMQCWFNSQDHKPPHFHAKKSGQWEYRIFFMKKAAEMLEVKWQKTRISRQDRTTLCDEASECRPELLKEWEEKVKYAD
jgi:hypothetical protein